MREMSRRRLRDKSDAFAVEDRSDGDGGVRSESPLTLTEVMVRESCDSSSRSISSAGRSGGRGE